MVGLPSTVVNCTTTVEREAHKKRQRGTSNHPSLTLFEVALFGLLAKELVLR